MVLLVDGDNVRGKSGFSLSKEQLLQAVAMIACHESTAPLSVSVMVYFDHGTQQETFLVPAETLLPSPPAADTTSSINNFTNTSTVGVVFAGPDLSADDVIARDVQWLQQNSVGSRGVVLAVATQDMGLRKRCRPKAVRLSKKEAKKRSGGGSTQREASPSPALPGVRIVSSRRLAESAVALTMTTDDAGEEAGKEAAEVAPTTINSRQKPSGLFAQRQMLSQGLELKRRLRELRGLLRTCTRRAYPSLKAEVEALETRVAALSVTAVGGAAAGSMIKAISRGGGEAAADKGNDNGSDDAAAAAGESIDFRELRVQMRACRLQAGVEETWERVVWADALQARLQAQVQAGAGDAIDTRGVLASLLCFQGSGEEQVSGVWKHWYG
jgi:hypothetical protein